MPLTQDERVRAEFFARLASTPIQQFPGTRIIAHEVRPTSDLDGNPDPEINGPSYDEIDERSKAQLMSMLRRLPGYIHDSDPWRTANAFRASRGLGPLPTEWRDAWTVDRLLSTAWREVWTVLNNLLEGRGASLRYLTLFVHLQNGVLHVSTMDRQPAFSRLLAGFYDTLRIKPFPFGRCPNCRAVFVRVRRQRYCSSRCASQSLEAARKGKRREYMRELMRRKRERERVKREAMRRARERTAQRKER
jgi:hypothetical protein